MTELQVTLKLEPVGKERPRVGRFKNVYTPAKTLHYERAVASLLRHELGPIEPFTCGVLVEIDFYLPKPKKPTHPFPSQYDLDNLLKSVLDAANRVVWADDNLVREIKTRKLYGDARIEFRAKAVPA